MQKRGSRIDKLIETMKDLENEIPLLPKYAEHPLLGKYRGFTECHIEPDWLLIYKIDRRTGEIYFSRTGTHADLF